jgi:hypothetical protein
MPGFFQMGAKSCEFFSDIYLHAVKRYFLTNAIQGFVAGNCCCLRAFRNRKNRALLRGESSPFAGIAAVLVALMA